MSDNLFIQVVKDSLQVMHWTLALAPIFFFFFLANNNLQFVGDIVNITQLAFTFQGSYFVVPNLGWVDIGQLFFPNRHTEELNTRQSL